MTQEYTVGKIEQLTGENTTSFPCPGSENWKITGPIRNSIEWKCKVHGVQHILWQHPKDPERRFCLQCITEKLCGMGVRELDKI